MPAELQEPKVDNPFVSTTLGPWSSHPDMLARQKKRLLRIGLVPFWVAILAVVLVLTHYRPPDFAAVHDWTTFLAACGVLWKKIKLSLAVLAVAGCFSAGFALTLNLLWMVGMTMPRKLGRDVAERDSLPFPAWVLACFCLFWLLPPVLWFCRGFFSTLDWRLNLAVQLSANLLCILPAAVLLAWTGCVGKKQPGPGEELYHPVGHLLAAVVLLAAAGMVCVMPRPEAFDKMMDAWFGWVGRCGIDVDTVYGWVRTALAAVLAVWGAFHGLLWRLKTEIRPKKRRRGRNGSGDGEETGGEEADGREEIPSGARYLLENLPEGVAADKDGPDGESVYRRQVAPTSPYALPGEAGYGLEYLLGGGKLPTKDQLRFFTRYVESFREARKAFGYHPDGRNGDGTERADLLLLGEDGTGRTEIMLAAALYAVVVRGQRALYLCADNEACSRLADRVSQRLEWLGVDGYITAARLDPLAVGDWLEDGDDSRGQPPDLMFATPAMAERSFFLNPATRQSAKAKAMKRLLTGFGAVFVDDFLDMPPTFRAHTAFLLDKLKLLQAAEPVLAQYAVAASPLQKPDGEEALGMRLFGEDGFDRKRNVCELHPRPCGPYWFGTLRVANGALDGDGEGLSLEKAMQELVKVSVSGGCRTLVYQKGMSNERKELFKNELDIGAADGNLEIASRYRELAELEAVPDNVFYLSLACGDAGAALRLNLDGGDPVFFRIALEGEPEPERPREFGLIPNETALPLRIHHLRSVLQYIDVHVPVPDTAWARFKITMNHPCARELVPGGKSGTVSVEWLHDEYSDGVYGPGMLWPYLSLETAISLGVAGGGDFNSLPTDRGEIWKSADGGGRLLLAEAEDGGTEARPGHLAVWRNEKTGAQIGESDLAHADELVYSGADEYTVANTLKPDASNARRYAVLFQGQYRHGSDTEFIHPVRRLSWNIPRGGLRVPNVMELEETAHFKVERTVAATCRVDGRLCGMLNARGKPIRHPARDYSYESYLSCLVLLPTLKDGAGDEDPASDAETLVAGCLDGAWRTEASSGFSCALTHALGAALRRMVGDWSFYAVAPAFWTEGREDSVGCVTVWVLEPANSGRTVQPLLERLMKEDREFRKKLYETARETLEECNTLEELRMASRLAFDGESLEEDERRKAIGVLDTLLDMDRAGEWMAKRLRDRKETRKKRKETEGTGRRPRVGEVPPEEREFDKTVVEALVRFDDTIDVTKFAVEQGWDCDRIGDLFMDVLWNHPEVFWVAKKGRYQWWTDSAGKITRFVITDLLYAFGADEYPKRKAELDRAVGEALESVEGAGDDVEKALRLHDYIVRVCDYDLAASKRKDPTPLARTAYSVLVRHSAVCEGYTMAYRLLLSKVGIESEEVLSETHCWNYVRLGDSWYHVDVTWDDPVFSGKKPKNAPLSRRNFLMSDAHARETEHEEWSVRGLPGAADTTYDGMDWETRRAGDGGQGRKTAGRGKSGGEKRT